MPATPEIKKTDGGKWVSKVVWNQKPKAETRPDCAGGVAGKIAEYLRAKKNGRRPGGEKIRHLVGIINGIDDWSEHAVCQYALLK